MRPGLYVPLDELAGAVRHPDVGADFLELAAFFAADGFVMTSDIANEASIGADEEASALDHEMRDGVEEIVSEVVQRIEDRRAVLGSAYPFRLDRNGDILSYEATGDSLGQCAYVLSLVLSNLQEPGPGLGQIPDPILRLGHLPLQSGDLPLQEASAILDDESVELPRFRKGPLYGLREHHPHFLIHLANGIARRRFLRFDWRPGCRTTPSLDPKPSRCSVL